MKKQTEKKIRFCVMLPSGLVDKIRLAAARQRRTMSALIQNILEPLMKKERP